MKKSELRNIIREELIQLFESASYVDPGLEVGPEQPVEPTIAELSSTSAVPGYMTPKAFKPTNGDEDEEGGCPDPEVLGYTKVKKVKKENKRFLNTSLIQEINYNDYRNDDSATSKQKVNTAIGAMNSQLGQIERLVNQNLRLKTEMSVSTDHYWKSTKQKLQKISERMIRISGRLRELWS